MERGKYFLQGGPAGPLGRENTEIYLVEVEKFSIVTFINKDIFFQKLF